MAYAQSDLSETAEENKEERKEEGEEEEAEEEQEDEDEYYEGETVSTSELAIIF